MQGWVGRQSVWSAVGNRVRLVGESQQKGGLAEGGGRGALMFEFAGNCG